MNNKMLSSLALLCAALLTQSADARDCKVRCEKPENKCHYRHDDKPFFITVGTGASWSGSDKIEVDHVTAADQAGTKFWDGAVEGYNDHRNASELYTVGLGYHWNDWLSTGVELTHRPSYSYKQAQTQATAAPLDNVEGLEHFGPKTRYFDLKNTSITFNIDLRAGGFSDCMSWSVCENFQIQPIIGFGVGIAYNRIENFHSISADRKVRSLVGRAGLIANTDHSDAVASAVDAGTDLIGAGTIGAGTADEVATVLNAEHALAARDILVRGTDIPNSNQVHSIMNDRTKTDFVWQVKLGLGVAYKRVFFDLFYRYHDAGKFRTHNYTVDAATNALDPAKVPAWSGDVTAHELCFNCSKKF